MIYATQDYPLDHLVVGCILAAGGLMIIIFHRLIKEWGDYMSSKDFPVGWGEMWSGKYTKGGLIFTYAIIIAGGAGLFISGIILIVKAFTE